MIGALVRAVVRRVRQLVIVAALAAAASLMGVPVLVTLGYVLVGWAVWVVLRVPVRMARRRGRRPARAR